MKTPDINPAHLKLNTREIKPSIIKCEQEIQLEPERIKELRASVLKCKEEIQIEAERMKDFNEVNEVISILEDPTQRKFFNWSLLSSYVYTNRRVTCLGGKVISQLFDLGFSVKDVSKLTRISYATIYNRKKKLSH